MAFFRFVSAGTSRILTFLLLTAILISIESIVTHSSVFSLHPVGLSMAILFDLVFVTTALFYWIVARPLRLAISQLIVVALLMLRVSLLIVPATAFLSAPIWPALLALVEGSVLIVTGLRIRTISQTYRQLRLETDTETALQRSLAVVFGKKAARFLLGEGLIVYYVLMGWRLQPDIPTEAQTFTTHRQSGQVALTIGLLSVGIIEGVGLHLLLSRWNPIVAFWITALSVYGMLFFVADIIATVKRPLYLTHNQLNIRLGMRWRASIVRAMITDVSLINEKPAKQSDQLNGAFLTAPNVRLTFCEPVCFTGPYGLQKTVRHVSFFVDDRATFVRALSNGL